MNQSGQLLFAPSSLALLGILPATAHQITGTHGSPSATTTIDSNYIPQSVASVRRRDQPQCEGTPSRGGRKTIVQPKGAPNILLSRSVAGLDWRIRNREVN